MTKNAKQSAWKGCYRLLGTSWQQAWGSRSQCTHIQEKEWCVLGLSVLLLSSLEHQPEEGCHQHFRWVSPRGSFSENTPQTHPQVYSLGAGRRGGDDNEALHHRSPSLKGQGKGVGFTQSPVRSVAMRGGYPDIAAAWWRSGKYRPSQLPASLLCSPAGASPLLKPKEMDPRSPNSTGLS